MRREDVLGDPVAADRHAAARARRSRARRSRARSAGSSRRASSARTKRSTPSSIGSRCSRPASPIRASRSRVFLFAGPTGTGKTELAKTLAEFLFGSAERLIRLDMSEFQAVESTRKILGDADQQARRTALTAPRPQAAVLGRAARRVREGASERLGPVPPGVRRRPADRCGRADRRLPALHHHPDVEPRRDHQAGRGPGLRVARSGAFSPDQVMRPVHQTSAPSSSTGSTRSSSSAR